MFNSFAAPAKRKTSLPTRGPYYSPRERDARPPSIRLVLINLISRPKVVAVLLLGIVALLGWLLGIFGRKERVRIGGGPKVIARDFEVPFTELTLADGTPIPDQVVLILCPMKNSIEHIWHFFHLIDSLTYPRHLIQIGILVSDSTDRTYERALELADERQYSRRKAKRYNQISVFRKDFAEEMGFEALETLGGKERHALDVQVKRRMMLAYSRTWLMNAAMRPETDWALWIDVDVVNYEPSLIQTLLSWTKKEVADVVVPNCVWKTYNELGPYERNNWAETPKSLAMKAKIGTEEILIEGYEDKLPTYRLNMADMVPAKDDTPHSMQLDSVGGCTTLVRASLHRKGAVFPSWPVDHQLETEGFAQLAKELGARLVGLPRYYVHHGLYG